MIRKLACAMVVMAVAIVSVRADDAKYAAIAYSQKTGAYGYSSGCASQEKAEKDALAKCSGSDAKVVVWVKNGWCALAWRDGYYGYSSGDGRDAVGKGAMAEFRKVTNKDPYFLLVSSAGPVEYFAAADVVKENQGKSLVGVWEAEGVKGSTLEFSADGKFTATVKKDNSVETISGTYTIDGKTLKLSTPQGKIDVTLDKWSATELVTINDKNTRMVWAKVGVKVDVGVDKAKLIGVWVAEGSKGLSAGSTLEFTADGKITVTIKGDNKSTVLNWTYTVDGNRVKAVVPATRTSPATTEIFIIETLTAKELVTIDDEKNRDVFVKQGAAQVDTKGELTAEEQKVLDLTNAERKNAGLDPLKPNAKLIALARNHSRNMARQNKLDHTLDNKSPSDRMDDAGYGWSAWGENVSHNRETPTAVVAGWMNSKGHKANILSTNFTEIGIGLAKNNRGEPYWTQVFGKPR